MDKFAVIFDEVFLRHSAGEFHPESPHRVKVMLEGIKSELNDVVEWVSPEPAKKEEILWNHSEDLYLQVESTQGQRYTQLDPDTAANAFTFEAALKAVGAQKTGLRLLLEEDFSGVFCLVRPPGHHAEYDRAMGFCFFNNVAIAAHYAMNYYNLERIFIIDWDVHHGNGTQKSFYYTSKVLYFSLHQYPYYPGTGHYTEIGNGEGRGFTLNVPLYPYCGDQEYCYVFKELLVPVVKQYKPQLILVSAGFDCCKDDPLADMEVSPDDGIAYFTQTLKELAEEFCKGKVLFTLEGGYSLNNLKIAGVSLIKAFLGMKKSEFPELSENRIKRLEEKVLTPLRDLLGVKSYWEFY